MYWLDVWRLRRGEYIERCEAAKRLGMSQKRRAVEPLMAALEDSDGQEPLAAAAHALGMLADRRAISPLVTVLAGGNGPLIAAARGALDRIDPDWPATEDARRAVPLLAKALDEWLEKLSRSSQPRPRETAAETRQRIDYQERHVYRLIGILERIEGRPADESCSTVLAIHNRDMLFKLLRSPAPEVEEPATDCEDESVAVGESAEKHAAWSREAAWDEFID